MSLIAKNKITEYIVKHPQARITLLSWLKEYPYREGKNFFAAQEGKLAEIYGAGHSQPGIGNYVIKYKINSFAKAVLITWVGSKEELVTAMDKELREMQKQNPGHERESIKVIDVVLKVPPSIRTRKPLKGNAIVTRSDPAVLPQHVDERNTPYSSVQVFMQQETFETEADYQDALVKVNTIFHSQPVTSSFDELTALLNRIGNYENYKLEFPPVEAFEIVKDRMDMFGLPANYLIKIIGSEEKVQLFLSGKLELSAKKLEQIFKRVHINFPVSDL